MRLSRGRSTPTRRAMWWPVLSEGAEPFGLHGGLSCRIPVMLRGAPAIRSGGASGRRKTTSAVTFGVFSCRCCSVGLQCCGCSALALLVARVVADHHDAAVATDHLALVTDRLDARVDLHVGT